MSEISQAARAHTNASAGHLEVRIEGAHPVEMSFSFEQRQKRVGPAALASLAYHVLFVAAIIFAVRYGSYRPPATALVPDTDFTHLVWLSDPGPGGGGGGGGNRMKEPPRKAEAPGKDKVTVQVEKPPQLESPLPQPKIEPPHLEQLNIPAKSLADAQQALPGAVEALPGPSALSLGPGSLGGAGTGTGTGSGPGTGSGLGPGSGGGTGGGIYRVGNGVTTPRVILEVKPTYTSDAMRAKLQGTVSLEFVVLPDGTAGNIRVIRSLDRNFGLDQQAIEALKKCRFEPGRLRGQPVAVLATFEMEFTLR